MGNYLGASGITALAMALAENRSLQQLECGAGRRVVRNTARLQCRACRSLSCAMGTPHRSLRLVHQEEMGALVLFAESLAGHQSIRVETCRCASPAGLDRAPPHQLTSPDVVQAP